MNGSLGLVLSGGFLRGAFQVGVIEALHARGLRFENLGSSGVQLRVGATSIRERRLRWFESWASREAFFDTLIASNYLPGVYGAPIRIDGRYYADGGFVDNVPYEAALEQGCERALVVVPDWRGRIWKRLWSRGPHEVPSSSRERLVVIHPDAPLPIGRVRADLDGVLRCIDAGHRAAERTLAECFDRDLTRNARVER